MAGLTSDALSDLRAGVCVGSTMGSTHEIEHVFGEVLKERNLEGVKSTHFFKIMNNSCASNLAQALGIRGRLLDARGGLRAGAHHAAGTGQPDGAETSCSPAEIPIPVDLRGD